jgi:two-component system response regulator HydG
VRELEHAIERAVVLAPGEVIEADALALDGAAVAAVGGDVLALPATLTLDEVERAWARAAVERAGGNQSAAARSLGISRNKLARLLR